MKIKKRKKNTRMHGRKMGTSGRGARKKGKGSGHRGGIGLSGSGKRADHKKTLITKLYGGTYFGKKGVTSRGTAKDKSKKINVGEIQSNFKPGEVNLSDHKILGNGEVRDKFVIKAYSASESAIKKVASAGGKIVLPKKEKVEKENSSNKERVDKKKEEPLEETSNEAEKEE